MQPTSVAVARDSSIEARRQRKRSQQLRGCFVNGCYRLPLL